jgi:hypothetical protein
VTDSSDRRLGSSGVFKAIVMSARRLKRALSDSDAEVPPHAEDLGNTIAQAFMSGKIGDVWGMSTAAFRQRTPREAFVDRWTEAIAERGGLTAFEVSNAGNIDLQYVPGLEDVPQSMFVAFIEIVFGSPTIPLENEKAFTVGAVLLFDDGQLRIGAIHAR